MRDLGVIADAGVLCREGAIAWVGPMIAWEEARGADVPEFDAGGMVAFPGFVDSHTHAMFAGSRDMEFALRAEGATYQQIAERGGGILTTVRAVRSASKRDLKRPTAGFDVTQSPPADKHCVRLFPDKGHSHALEHFVRCYLEGGNPDTADGTAGARATRLAEALLESQQRGQPVACA